MDIQHRKLFTIINLKIVEYSIGDLGNVHSYYGITRKEV